MLKPQGRFIPTRVGYTKAAYGDGISVSGSSPLAWGILYSPFPHAPNLAVHPHSRGVYILHESFIPLHTRFIPTRVGYTPAFPRSSHEKFGSSPLAWGIQYRYLSFPQIYYGSSPLAWGILCFFVVGDSTRRFIPTRVGYTDIRTELSPVSSVHPHSRGVYPVSGSISHCFNGSSPLAWGILI